MVHSGIFGLDITDKKINPNTHWRKFRKIGVDLASRKVSEQKLVNIFFSAQRPWVSGFFFAGATEVNMCTIFCLKIQNKTKKLNWVLCKALWNKTHRKTRIFVWKKLWHLFSSLSKSCFRGVPIHSNIYDAIITISISNKLNLLHSSDIVITTTAWSLWHSEKAPSNILHPMRPMLSETLLPKDCYFLTILFSIDSQWTDSFEKKKDLRRR